MLLIFKFFLVKQRIKWKQVDVWKNFENVCSTLLFSVVCYIPFHVYLIVPFCTDLRNTVFIFCVCNYLLIWELLCKTLSKLGHSTEECAGLIMIILLPWAFLCLLNLLKYYFIAGAKNLPSKKLCGTWYASLSSL